MSDRRWDLVVFGATGFTGALIAEYLSKHAPAHLRLALAGRSRDKLEGVRRGLGEAGARFDLFTADSSQPATLDELARSTRVLATTVGPYAKYGLPVVEACAKAGTDYCDLAGEPLFMRESIDRFDAIAKSSGARIVHATGFDSIPSDLGVLILHDFLTKQGKPGTFERITLGVTHFKGTFSGGTFASAAGGLQEAMRDRTARRLMGDPYSLSPDRSKEPDLGRQRDLTTLRYDDFLEQWTAPFVMASVNTRVVRRSNALLGHAYGRSLDYREVTALRPGLKGVVYGASVTATLATLVLSQSTAFTRSLIERFAPKPGEGPDRAAREAGFFKMRLEGLTTEGERVHALVAGVQDPGYGETSKMFSHAALCLVEDREKSPRVAGVLTPATALGLPLVERLRGAGMTFEARSGKR